MLNGTAVIERYSAIPDLNIYHLVEQFSNIEYKYL